MYEFLAKLPHGTSVTVVLNYGGRVGGINCYTYKVDNNLNLYMQGVYTMKMTECFKSVEKKIDVIIEKKIKTTKVLFQNFLQYLSLRIGKVGWAAVVYI